MKPNRNTSPGSQSSSSRKPASRGKSAKQKRSTSEKISKYFTKDESAANITPPYSNVKAIRKITASDDDDFKSPIVAKKLAPVFTRAAKKRTTKTMAKCSESRTARQETVNEEHLRLALALSISSQEGSSEFVENVPVYPSTQEVRNNAKRTLEQYGFHSSKEYTTRSLSDETKRSKKSRFKYITPTLLLRTEEDRANKISAKLSSVLNEFTHVKEEEPSKEPLLLYSEELQRYRSKNRLYSAQSAPLSNDRDVENFYVANLSLSPCTTKCGSRLKRWECIPGRDKSPVKEELKVKSPVKEELKVKPGSLKRSRSPDLFESDDELFANNSEGKTVETSCVAPKDVGNESVENENVKDEIQKESEKLFTENSGDIIDLSQSSDSNSDEPICTTSTEKPATFSSVNFIVEKYLNSSEDDILEEVCLGVNRTDEETNSKKFDLHGTSLKYEARSSNSHQINSSLFKDSINLESFTANDRVFNDIDMIDTSLSYRTNQSCSVDAKVPFFHNKSDKGKKSNVVHINLDLTQSNRASDNTTKNCTETDKIYTNINAQETSFNNSDGSNTSLFDNSSDKENFPENGANDNQTQGTRNSFDAHEANLSNFNRTNIPVFNDAGDKENFFANGALDDKYGVQETNFVENLSFSISKNTSFLDKSSFFEADKFDTHSSNRMNKSSNSSDKEFFSENGAIDCNFDVQDSSPNCKANQGVVSPPSLDKSLHDNFDARGVSLSDSIGISTTFFDNFIDSRNFPENSVIHSKSFDRSKTRDKESFAKIDNCDVSGTNQSYEGNLNNSFRTNKNNTDKENLTKIDDFDVSGTNQSYEGNLNHSFRTNLSPECAPKNVAPSECDKVYEISSDSDISDDEVANLSQKMTSFTSNYVVETERVSFENHSSSSSQESITISDEELNYSCIHSTPAKTINQPSEELVHSTPSKTVNFEDCTPQKNTLPRKILHPRIQQLSSKKVDTFGKILDQNSLSDLIETPQKNNENETNLVVKTKNVTPMPAYEAMDTPEVARELSKYGVKKLKRRRGVELLKYIYESTHPSLEACENGKEEEDRSAKRRRRLDLSEDEEKRVDIIGDELIVTDNDVILEKKKSKKILSCLVPLHIAWHNLLATDRQLQENVLLYEPLQVEVLHGMLKDQGMNFHVQDLISFLDKKCITIRTGQNQGGRRKRY